MLPSLATVLVTYRTDSTSRKGIVSKMETRLFSSEKNITYIKLSETHPVKKTFGACKSLREVRQNGGQKKFTVCLTCKEDLLLSYLSFMASFERSPVDFRLDCFA